MMTNTFIFRSMEKQTATQLSSTLRTLRPWENLDSSISISYTSNNKDSVDIYNAVKIFSFWYVCFNLGYLNLFLYMRQNNKINQRLIFFFKWIFLVYFLFWKTIKINKNNLSSCSHLLNFHYLLNILLTAILSTFYQVIQKYNLFRK